eukprot:TRINITY_DN7806_c0_g1_i3.p1 TRINITY_DN7806_c0_g1~~TRINITY_DN7806_c0_g1_i3.p1  ORF type:complete len:246 (-),score=43.42 TRINITY_DN7806_c0_g1_i3:976-1713(-)
MCIRDRYQRRVHGDKSFNGFFLMKSLLEKRKYPFNLYGKVTPAHIPSKNGRTFREEFYSAPRAKRSTLSQRVDNYGFPQCRDNNVARNLHTLSRQTVSTASRRPSVIESSPMLRRSSISVSRDNFLDFASRTPLKQNAFNSIKKATPVFSESLARMSGSGRKQASRLFSAQRSPHRKIKLTDKDFKKMFINDELDASNKEALNLLNKTIEQSQNDLQHFRVRSRDLDCFADRRRTKKSRILLPAR